MLGPGNASPDTKACAWVRPMAIFMGAGHRHADGDQTMSEDQFRQIIARLDQIDGWLGNVDTNVDSFCRAVTKLDVLVSQVQNIDERLTELRST